MQLTLGFSPCPNDTFIFDALIHNRIDTKGYEFDVILDDVEALNQKAFNAELDITKLSYHAGSYLTNHYTFLNAGSALGSGVGPLIITTKENLAKVKDIKNITIAIPGKYTTANFLLKAAFGNQVKTKEFLFSDIENAVLEGKVDAGVIIHENRFTYHEKGLVKVIDLGEYWESKTHQLIPLGGIAIKKSLPTQIQQDINSLIRESIEFAYKNPSYSLPFIKENAQEMDSEVMKKHIDLYVNEYSLNLGEKGKNAIKFMFDFAIEKGFIPSYNKNLFVEPKN
jgi:1,4-dihydroxy-6-naphthoate synthase